MAIDIKDLKVGDVIWEPRVVDYVWLYIENYHTCPIGGNATNSTVATLRQSVRAEIVPQCEFPKVEVPIVSEQSNAN